MLAFASKMLCLGYITLYHACFDIAICGVNIALKQSAWEQEILTIFEGPYSVCEPPLQGGAMHCVLIDQNARKAIFAPRTKSRRRRAYHQCEALYVTNGLPLYIIIAKAIQPAVDEILALARYARQSG